MGRQIFGEAFQEATGRTMTDMAEATGRTEPELLSQTLELHGIGATTTCWRLRINGAIEEPLGRNTTVAPPATLPTTASNAAIR